MKWAELKTTVVRKLGGRVVGGTKHDFGFVSCGNQLIGKVKISRGREMTSKEIGGCSSSLRISESQFRNLVGCSLSADDFCAIAMSTDA